MTKSNWRRTHPDDKRPDAHTDEQTERARTGQRPTDGDEHTSADGSGDGDELDMVWSEAPGLSARGPARFDGRMGTVRRVAA